MSATSAKRPATSGGTCKTVRAESIDTATWNTLTAVTELTLHSQAVATVFDLLGGKEDDITYSVGWGLAQSEGFTRSVLREAYGDAEQGEITAIRGTARGRITPDDETWPSLRIDPR